MKRRGKCRCGAILLFSKTSRGYKTKCPQCGAVVRLRVEEQDQPRRKPAQKSRSAVLAAVGPPPLPEAYVADHSAPVSTTPDEGLDFSGYSDHESTAPQALAEIEVYSPPKKNSGSILPWIVFGLLAALVSVGVGIAAMLWG